MLQIQVADHDVQCDLSTSLTANASCCAFNRVPSTSQDPPKLLGGGHKNRVDGHTGRNAQSGEEATQDAARGEHGRAVE